MATFVSIVSIADNASSVGPLNLSVTYAAGDRAVIWWSYGNGGTIGTTISDGTNTYTLRGSEIHDAGNSQTYAIYECLSTAAGTFTLAGTLASAQPFRGLAAIRYSGASAVTAAQVIGQNQVSPGSGANAISSTNLTPASQPGTLIGITMDDLSATAISAGTGFTDRGAMTNVTSTFGSATRVEDKAISSTAAVAATFTQSPGTGTFATFAVFIPDAAAGADQPPQDAWDFAGDDAGWYDESALLEAATPTQSVDLVPLPIQLDETQQPWWDGYDEPLVEMLATLQEMAQPPPVLGNGLDDGWMLDEDADVELWLSFSDSDSAPVGADAAVAGQPPDDGYSPQFDDADLDELFIDDYANEDADALRDDAWDWYEEVDDALPEPAVLSADAVAPAGMPPEDAWPWDDAGDDDYTVGLDDDDDAVGADQPPLPSDDAWVWDEGADDPLTLDDQLGADASAPLPALGPVDDWQWLEEHGEDWSPEDAVLGADLLALAGLGPDDAWAFDDEVEPWVPDDAVLSADATAADQPPAVAWDWADEVEDVLPDQSQPVDGGDMPAAEAWDWHEEVADEWADDARAFADPPPIGELPVDDAWPWFDDTSDEPTSDDTAAGANLALLPANLAGDDAWPWSEEWVTDPWPDDVVLSGDGSHGRRIDHGTGGVQRTDVRTGLRRSPTSTIRRG